MLSNFAIFDLATPELLIILVIILLLFGGRKLPELTKSLGDSVKELRKGFSDDTHDEPKKSAAKEKKN